jgi:hypothetical protein
LYQLVGIMRGPGVNGQPATLGEFLDVGITA